MQWFTCIFRPAVQKFVRMHIGSKAFGDKPVSAEQKEGLWNEIQNMILPKLELHLRDKQRNFFCTEDDLTIVDLQYFQAIQQLTKIDKAKNISQGDFPELHSWIGNVKQQFTKRSTDQSSAIDSLENSFTSIISHY